MSKETKTANDKIQVAKVKASLANRLSTEFVKTWPGCRVADVYFLSFTGKLLLQPLPKRAFILSVLDRKKEEVTRLLVTQMHIEHPKTGLALHYKTQYEVQSINLEQKTGQARFTAEFPTIALTGIGNAQNVDVKNALPLITVLRKGNSHIRRPRYDPETQAGIVELWHASGLYGNDAQDEFGRKYGTSGRTLRTWIKKHE